MHLYYDTTNTEDSGYRKYRDSLDLYKDVQMA